MISEIKKVGLKNWLWFVFILNRNEFSPKLDLFPCLDKGKSVGKLIRARNLAHEIDMELS